MLASIASFAQSLGAAFLLSELGAAELILGLLVAAGLVGCAVQGPDREHDHHGHGNHGHA
jgi:hypothetical protein